MAATPETIILFFVSRSFGYDGGNLGILEGVLWHRRDDCTLITMNWIKIYARFLALE